jgi:hypothetical protein
VSAKTWRILRHWGTAGVRPLSYTILLEEVLAEKKCRQKHGGFWPEMTPD